MNVEGQWLIYKCLVTAYQQILLAVSSPSWYFFLFRENDLILVELDMLVSSVKYVITTISMLVMYKVTFFHSMGGI